MEIEWRESESTARLLATRRNITIAERAAAQFGVITHDQLCAAGLGDRAVQQRCDEGTLVRLHPLVYAVGHARLRPEGHRLAAVWAGGDQAVLSHRSAGEAHGLIADARARYDITVPPEQARGRTDNGLILHRARLSAADRTSVDGVPCTSVPRTLVDLGATRDPRLVARAVDQAMVLERYDQTAVDEILRRPGRLRGVAVLRSVLEDRHPDSHLTRSVLERRALERLDHAGVARAAVNVWLPEAGVEVDLLWKNERLVVELDGRRYHAHRLKRDRERDARLESLGYRVRRFGWGDVTAGPFIAEIRRELSRI